MTTKKPFHFFVFAVFMIISGAVMTAYSLTGLTDITKASELIAKIPFHSVFFFYFDLPEKLIKIFLALRLFLRLRFKIHMQIAQIRPMIHGAAIGAISKGAADVAIVKNRVWESVKGKYPNLVRVGEDAGENPNGTLIISNKADRAVVAEVKSVLLALKNDNSAEAKAVKKSLGIDGYIETTGNDFQFTIPMLKKAGVTKGFNFKY